MTTWNLVGQMTMGSCLPSSVAAVAAIDASVGASLPELQAQLAGLAAASVSITTPDEIAATFALAANVTIPPISVGIDAMASIKADLQASIGALQANLAVGAALSAQLGTSGIWLYHVHGAPVDIIPGGIPGVSGSVEGVILLGADAGAIDAIRAVFRTS